MLHSRWRPWKQSERTDTARLVHATGRRASRVKGAARQAARCMAPVCAKRPAEAKAQAAADPGRGAGQRRGRAVAGGAEGGRARGRAATGGAEVPGFFPGAQGHLDTDTLPHAPKLPCRTLSGESCGL